MTKSFDYASDPKLDCLPAALRLRMVAVQQFRIDAGFTAKNGMTYGNAIDRDKANAAFDRRTKESTK